MAESRLRVVPWIMVGVFATLWITKGAGGAPQQKVADSTPTILESFRKLGFLQSAEMNLSEAFRLETYKQPAEALQAIPGADQLVKSATQNEVWVHANGKISAGVDLSKATVRLQGDTVYVHLPKVTIQRPDVDLKLVSNKKGWFWRDENILLKAIGTARERFTTSVAKLNIERKALESAEEQVRTIVGKVTPRKVVIEGS